MKKRIILTSIILLLLTGCSVDYNLSITEEKIAEEIYLYAENNTDNSAIYNNQEYLEAYTDSEKSSETNQKLEGVEYYSIEKYLENNFYTAKLAYSFSKDNYIKSKIASFVYFLLFTAYALP